DIDIDLSGRDNSNPDGVEYTYSIEAEDAAGNVNTTIKDQTLTVDTVAKLTASGNDYDDGALEITNRSDVNDQNYAGKTPTFSGQSDANATIKLVLTSSTSGVLNPEPITVEANASGDWSIDLALENVSLVEGADYEYTITVTDIAGNTTNAEGDELQLTGDFTVDSTTDLVDDSIKLDQASDTGLTDNDKQATLSDQKTSLNTPTIEGKAEVGSIVTVTIEGDSNSPYTLDPITNVDGYWSVTTKELASGTYNYTVSTVDRAGNTDSETSSFTIDSDAPAPVEVTKISEQLLGDLAFVDDHYITGEANPVFSGTAEKGARVYLEFNGQTYSADADNVTGVWSIPLPDVGDASLEQGIDRSVTLYVKDDAGNKSDETQIHYTLDQKTTLDINSVDMSDGSNSSDKGDMLTNFNGETHLVFTGTSGSAEQGATIEY
ncbi:Ig-like domain-containing protein, partial [Vibrio ponticus]